MAAAAGKPRLETAPSDGSTVQSVAWRSGGDVVLWLANLTGEVQMVEIDGLPQGSGLIARLDQDSFAMAVSGPDGFVGSRATSGLDRVELGPYAVASLTVQA
jgi:hypothetical protein